MAVFNEPTKWAQTLGKDADVVTIPDIAGDTDPSIDKIFPSVFSIPLARGGRAIPRSVLNGLFKLLGDWIYYIQNGGIASYSAIFDYAIGRVVLYNGNLYKCIHANGASSIVVTPDSNTAYWQRLDNFVRSVNGVNADASGNVQTGFPSDTFITIFENITNDATASPEAYRNSYTAPANGYVWCRGQRNLNERESACYIVTNRLSSQISSGKSASTVTTLYWGGTVPVKKGDVIDFLIYNLQLVSAKFIYAEGEI